MLDRPVSRWSYRITCAPPSTRRSTRASGQVYPCADDPATSRTEGRSGSPLRSVHNRSGPEVTKVSVMIGESSFSTPDSNRLTAELLGCEAGVGEDDGAGRVLA